MSRCPDTISISAAKVVYWQRPDFRAHLRRSTGRELLAAPGPLAAGQVFARWLAIRRFVGDPVPTHYDN